MLVIQVQIKSKENMMTEYTD